MTAKRIRLLVITTAYHHGLRYRLHHFLPYLKANFDVRIISIAPALYDVEARGLSLMASIKAWAKNVLARLPSSMIRHEEGVITLRSFPWSHPLLSKLDMLVIAPIIMRLKRLHEGFDACLATPQLACLSAFLAKPRAPIVCDYVDRAAPFERNPLIRLLVSFIEKYCLRNASLVIAAGYSLARSAREVRGGDALVVLNGIDTRLFSGKSATPPSEAFRLVYIGSVEFWSGLDEVVKAISILKGLGVKADLLIVGEGNPSYSGYLRGLCSEHGVSDRVWFLGPKKYKELPEILSSCHVGLATFRDIELSRYAFPFKVLEYMAVGLPVLVSSVKDAMEIVKAHGCGVIVECDAKAIAQALKGLFSSHEELSRMSKNARLSSQKFDIREEASKLIEAIRRVMEASTTKPN